MKYKVTYKIDSLDTNPSVEMFNDENEMFDYIHQEVERRINWSVEHSPYSLSNKDIKDLEAIEYSLVRIDEL